jgi:hypothetical protein
MGWHNWNEKIYQVLTYIYVWVDIIGMKIHQVLKYIWYDGFRVKIQYMYMIIHLVLKLEKWWPSD